MNLERLYSQTLLDIYSEDLPELESQWGLGAETCPESMDEEDWRLAKEAKANAKRFLDWAMQLHGAPREFVKEELSRLRHAEVNTYWDRIGATVFEFGPDNEYFEYKSTRENAYELWRFLLDLEICKQELSWLSEMTDRALQLLKLLVSARSKTTRTFLSRVAECYLRDMRIEGVVMCRAVLEAALAERMDTHDISSAEDSSLSRRVTLDGRLRHLRKSGVLSEDVFRAADSVRRAGNGAIHREPDKADFDSVFQDLIIALDGIESELPT